MFSIRATPTLAVITLSVVLLVGLAAAGCNDEAGADVHSGGTNDRLCASCPTS